MTTNDPFAKLGIPRRFDLDPQAVETAWRLAVAKLHPDRITDPLGQIEAAEATAQLNDARMCLLDDEARANALLALLGGPTKEEDKSLPPGFLMEIMEVRDEMATAMMSDEPTERTRFDTWARSRRADSLTQISEMFEGADTLDHEVGGAIRTELNVLRYIERMLEQLNEAP